MRKALGAVLALLLVLAGGAVLAWSLWSAPEPAAAPLPSSTWQVERPSPDPTRSAEVTPVPEDTSQTSDPGGSDAQVLDPGDMAPGRLYIPSLGVYATLTPERFSGGRLSLPEEAWRVGQDTESAPLTAAAGTTLVAGHVDLSGTPGALHRLGELPQGALIYLTDEHGQRSTFVASGLQTYIKTGLPRSIFDTAGPRQLAVVTCGGPIIETGGTRHYRDNVVVTAVPA